MCVHSLLDEAWDGRKRNLLIKIGRHGHLIGRIQYNRMAWARFERTISEPQAWKPIEVWFVKFQRPGGGQVSQ
jgi:hypothetical protein